MCVCGFVVLAYQAMVILLEKVEVVKPQVQKKNDAVHPYNYNVPLNSPSHLVLFPVAETKWPLLSPEYGNGVQNFLD